jgi:predicted nucleic-acid-binding protein
MQSFVVDLHSPLHNVAALIQWVIVLLYQLDASRESIMTAIGCLLQTNMLELSSKVFWCSAVEITL